MAAAFVLDHVFVAVEPDSAASRRLATAGFALAPPREHPGQGTANVCLHLEGGYLELLRARDAAELASPAVRAIGLGDRLAWRRTGASPFGLLLRGPADAPLPFPTVPYRAPFGDGRFVFRVADQAAEEGVPMIAILPPDLPAHGARARHPNGATRFGTVALDLPQTASAALRWMERSGFVSVREAAEPCMTLTFGETGGALDLAPDAPLSIRW